MTLQSLGRSAVFFAPMMLVFFMFFMPLSPSLKSVFFALSIAALLFTPDYNRYLFYAYNTLWGRMALLFFAWIMFACLWSPAPLAMQLSVLEKYAKLIYLPILAVGFINPATRDWCINAYLCSMLLTCIVALLKMNGLIEIGSHEDTGLVFYNHIITSFMMAVGAYFAALYTVGGADGWRRVFYYFMLFVTSYQVLFISNGKSGYIIYFILMVLFIIQKYRLKKAVVAMLFLSVALGAAYSQSPIMQKGITTLIHDVRLWREHNHSEDTSLSLRMQFHHYAQSLFIKHPIIGSGTGSFKYSFTRDQPAPNWGPKLNEPHSQYWMILAEQGLIGIVLLFLFLAILLKAALQLQQGRSMLLGLLAVFCIASFSDTIFCYSTAGYLLIIVSALGFGEFIERYAAANKSLPFK